MRWLVWTVVEGYYQISTERRDPPRGYRYAWPLRPHVVAGIMQGWHIAPCVFTGVMPPAHTPGAARRRRSARRPRQ